MKQARDIVSAHLRECGVPEQQIELGLAQWNLLPVLMQGEQIGAVVLQRGCEIHGVIVPAERGKAFITRARVAQVMQPLLDQYGYVTTRLARGDGSHRLFIDRLGFKPTWSDERHTYYMLTELPFGKRN